MRTEAERDTSACSRFCARSLHRDYEERPELDVYDAKDLDDTAYASSLKARRQAEEDLLKRDKKERKERQRSSQRGVLPSALLSSSSDEENEQEFFQSTAWGGCKSVSLTRGGQCARRVAPIMTSRLLRTSRSWVTTKKDSPSTSARTRSVLCANTWPLMPSSGRWGASSATFSPRHDGSGDGTRPCSLLTRARPVY